MNRYESSIPRMALGIAAATVTVLTFGLMVGAPAMLPSGHPGPPLLATPERATRTVTEVVIVPSPIVVVGVREPGAPLWQARELEAKRKPQV